MSAPDPALLRGLTAARAKREERGATGDGRVVVKALTADEALALDGLLAPRRPLLPGTDLRVPLSSFEAALSAIGIRPTAAYEGLGGPLRDLPAERAAARSTRSDFRAWLHEHPVPAARPRIAAWLHAAADQGRLQPSSQQLVARALTITAALPTDPPCQRAVLAAEMLDGDPHALDVDRPLHTLIVAMLTAEAELGAASARDVWRTYGVIVDPVSSTVACLNLHPDGDARLARLLRLMHGSHVVLTFGQLAAEPLLWQRGMVCHSCENPSVLIAAERELGGGCPPLVCTAGYPSDAVRALLAGLHAAGARLRHHGDGDAAGEQILDDLRIRYGAERWGLPVPGVAEELVIDGLLADLRRSAVTADRADG
ncbi:MAG TPA: TIGR02679 domain-containing protein [Solirubrobacteraceae bacterium]|nr:TIGR02679 domain-containing protein [Solirubrobacteraceae bacterium]